MGYTIPKESITVDVVDGCKLTIDRTIEDSWLGKKHKRPTVKEIEEACNELLKLIKEEGNV